MKTERNDAPRKRLRVGLVWQSALSTNLGLVALAQSNRAIVIEEAEALGLDVEIVFFSAKVAAGAESEANVGDRFVLLSRNMLSPAGMLRARRELNACDMLFDIGEGDSFSDIYGWLRFAKVAATKFLVSNAAEKLILSPQTIGPFYNPVAERIAAAAMKRVRHVFARDNISFARAADMLPANVHLTQTADIAFELPVRTTWPESFPMLSSDRVNVGLNVSGLLARGGYSGQNQFKLSLDYSALVDRLCAAFSAMEGVQLWLVPHVHNSAAASIESDRSVSLEIASRYPGVEVAPAFRSASDAKTFISKMDFFAGARMHATIAAVSTGVACVPMSYSLKFEGLYKSIGYLHVLSLTSASADEGYNAVMQGFHDRVKLSHEAKISAVTAKDSIATFRSVVSASLRDAAAR